MQTRMSDENIATLLTAPGAAAIAVVRLCGGGVERFLREHFMKPATVGRCVHGDVVDAGQVIDDALVVRGPGGDWADVTLHGGTWVVRRFLELARQSGFAVAEAAQVPLPDDAVDADSTIEREILTHVPLAKTELALRVLLWQREAWERLESRGDPSAARAELERIAGDPTLRRLLHPPTVAIVGAANVGKSTLANQLFGQSRSITADVPGTTRDWVGEIANIDGLAVMLVDTPGHRATEDAIERAAIEQSRGQIEAAELVVLVLDASRPLDPEQRPLLERFPDAIVVINKSDRFAAWDASNFPAVRTVATAGGGLDELRGRILRHFFPAPPSPERAYCWTDRQRQVIDADLALGYAAKRP